MKMKRRLFLNKSKKKKQNGADPVANESAPQTAGTEVLPSSDESKYSKKKLRFRKHKSKNQKPTENDPPTAAAVVISPNGTNVVLRRNPNENRVANTSKGNKRILEKRIPGSVSSSRTPSSASSSSSTRWSSRRPWSLADSLQAQSLSEFEEVVNDDEVANNLSDFKPLRSGRPLSTINILHRNPSVEEPIAHELSNSHPKTFSLDIHFLRRFKRSSIAVKTNKQDSTVELDAPQPSSAERLSFPQKKSNKSSKKNRRSWHEPSQFYAIYPSSESVETTASKGNDNTVRRSDTDPSSYNEIKEVIAEEQSQSVQTPAPSHAELRNSVSICSNSSAASTVISASEGSSVQSWTREHLTKKISNRSSGHSSCNERDDGMCEKCRKRRDGFRRSVCYCYFATPGICAVDDEPLSQRAMASQDDLDGSDGDVPTSPIHMALDDYTNLSESESGVIKWKKTMPLGGSLINLSAPVTSKWNDKEERTLTRQNVRTAAFRLQSTKGSAVYASSPQLCDESIKVNSKLKKDKKTMFSRDNATVDSPIKRAIAFPSVVLRRHHRLKKVNDPDLNKSSSDDRLSREQRAKQVISLNMEDLPTYNMTRILDDKADRLSGGHELSRTAILYQRYLSHATSFDDVSSIDALNMDDDELLNFYASTSQSNAALGREGDRSNQNQEPSSKRVKTLRKSVVSFASLISPGKPGRGKLQRSSSFKESIAPAYKPYRPPGSSNNPSNSSSSTGISNYTPGKRSSSNSSKKRQSKLLWSETFNHTGLDEVELKRQEAIYELYQGECVMVQDLKMAKQTYRDSMMTLKMLSDDHVTRIFGTLDRLLPLHEDLLARLEETRTESGRTERIGHVFIDWFPTLSPYNEYCANQADAKETLDAVVSRDKRVRDFLQRCLESPFSRKLDLWSYLDLPRSRLVKYPLLLKAILKATPSTHQDAPILEESLSMIDQIIARVDHLTGERQCRFVKSKLEYIDEKKRCPEVEKSQKILCSGQLKTSRGTKVQVFLFDRALVMTRNATRGAKLTYQVYRPPLPLQSVSIETDEGGKLSGSFRGGILSSEKTIKHAFRVRSEQLNIGYTFAATDEHDKKQWINSIQEAMSICQASLPQDVPSRGSPSTETSKKKRIVKRSSSSKSDSSVQSTDSQESRRSCEEKQNGKSLFKNRKNSTSRRSSVDYSVQILKSPKSTEARDQEEEKAFRRCKSLTGSPISALTAAPALRRRSVAGQVRNDSSVSKPPSGKSDLSPHRYTLRSVSTTSKTPPRSPRLLSTRSTPDLYSYLRRRSIEADRLLSINDQMTIEVPEPHQPSIRNYNTELSPLMVDSPDHPAASNTSRNFPVVEEDAISPLFKSLSSISATTSPTISVSFPAVFPIVAWAAPGERQQDPPINPTTSSRSSSESLNDVPPAMDDVDVILENAEINLADNSDASVSRGAMTSHDVLMTINDLLKRVCDEVSPFDEIQVACDENYITITSDDGTPWHGDDMEMSV